MGKITDILTGADAEQAADDALARRATAQKKANELDTVGLALLKEQAEIEEQIGRTADDAKALKLQARVDELKKLRDINNRRKRTAAEDLAKAEDDLRRARTVNRVKVIKKDTKKRADGATKMEQGIALLHEGWKAFFEGTEAINTFAGSDLLVGSHGGYGGMLLRTPEIVALVERELARVSGVGPLEVSLVPALPGSYVGGINPKNYPKLIDEIERANTYVVQCAEAMPAPASKVDKPKAEQPAQSPPMQPEEVAQPSGPTVSAEQIMAGLKPRKLTV